MKAGDTVMKRVQVNKAWEDMGLESSIPTFANYGETHPTYKLLKAQAEISFNAGRKEERGKFIKQTQDFYQTISGDIVIPKDDWKALKEEL